LKRGRVEKRKRGKEEKSGRAKGGKQKVKS
jgi:hypothetical protein